MKTINFLNRIDVKKECADIDALYGPYVSIQAALETIPKNRRAKGRTVGILQDNKVEEYWFKGGIENNNLVKKIVADITITEQELRFVDESTYEDLVEHQMIDPDVIYFVYEDQEEQGENEEEEIPL